MTVNLIIVESPAKVKRIAAFLGEGWRVEATRGHVRDLPREALGVDVNHGFQPQYEILPRQHATIKRLAQAAQEVDAIYLACDPDREGEAIAWHVVQVVKPTTPVYRVTFTEITEAAVKAAVAAPRTVDFNLVEAQQARRIIDRLTGYLVSPLACQGLGGRYSAGRVQSACLRLVVEREQAIASFQPDTYWTLSARFGPDMVARLDTFKGQSVTRMMRPQVDTICQGLTGSVFWIGLIRHNEQMRYPTPPFTTSTLQQAAYQALDLSPERCMELAQQLYEAGRITYHRTDGVSTAPEAIAAARDYITRTFGAEALPAQPSVYATKSQHAQEAHEAIRPTHIELLPSQDGPGSALYSLIWRRFVASQMAPARYAVQQVTICAGKVQGQPYPLTFETRGRTLIDEGFLRVYAEPPEPDAEPDDVSALPSLTEGEILSLLEWLPAEKQTQPPPCFSTATLVRELERAGVGRPSTYAATIQTLIQRGYIHIKNKRMTVTRSGLYLDDFLVRYFPDLFVPTYTARMETALDDIAQGNLSREKVLQAFWQDFSAQLTTAAQTLTGKRQPGHETHQPVTLHSRED